MTAIIGVLTLLAAIPAIGFVALYMFMPWHKSMIGRGVMLMMIDMVMLVALAVLRVFFGTEYPGREWLVLFVFAWLVVSLWVKFIALLRIQHRQRLEDRKP